MALVCLGLACLTFRNVLSLVDFLLCQVLSYHGHPTFSDPFLMNILGPLYVNAFAVGHLQQHERVLGSQQLSGKEVSSDGYVCSVGLALS